MNCNHRCYECRIPSCPDRIRQSIGPRIIPMFADPPEWSADKVYSPLTLVIHNGATFMSRRCVQANTALPDTDPFYNESWVMVYDMDAQVAQYREEVAQLSQQVTDFSGKVDSWEQMIVEWTALISNWSSQFPEFTKDLAAITERVATLETEMNQAQQDISALQATQQTHTEQIAANTQAIADLTPRVHAAEEHLTELDAEQQNQDERLNNIDQGQNLQNTQIKALQDADATNKQNISANSAQIAENAEAIAANAAEIAKHAERLEALETSQGEQDSKIQANANAIAQHTIDIGQAKAAAQQAQDTATHADAAAAQAQTTAEAAQEAAQAAQTAADQAKADNTTQDGRLDSLEAAQQQTAQDVASIKNGSTALPYIKDTGDTVTGTYDFTGADLTVKAPTANASPATKVYVDTKITNLKTGSIELPYLRDTGDTVTGTFNFTGATLQIAEPTRNNNPASKQYVDQAVQNATGGITPDVTQLKSDVEALQQSQGTQDGKITALENSQGTQDGKITALETAQTEQDSRLDKLENGTTALPYLKKAGDTGTGTFNFTGAALQIAEPTQNNNPASKQYVDQAVAGATDPELASKVEELENTISGITGGTTTLPYLSKNGDSSSGNYNFTGNVTVPVPSQAAQAVNKQYADAAITTAVDAVKEEIGLAGTTGHMVFVDTIKLPAGSNKTLTREAETDYLVTVFMPIAIGKGANLAIVAGDNTVHAVDGVIVTPGASDIAVSTLSGSYTAYVTIYKYFADGKQPQPDPTTFFTELNPPVVLTATTSNPQSVEGDLTATLNAMIATQPNWFKYKMQDGSGKTYYVMSASEIQASASNAANVLYCTDAGTWYQGETLTLQPYIDEGFPPKGFEDLTESHPLKGMNFTSTYISAPGNNSFTQNNIKTLKYNYYWTNCEGALLRDGSDPWEGYTLLMACSSSNDFDYSYPNALREIAGKIRRNSDGYEFWIQDVTGEADCG